ncbi:MAG TPA: MarR family transcriptional regulator [Acidimicrobiales bacterium]|nr:MarR family transcriptional regulator [Acidimicrobiales bacterium]
MAGDGRGADEVETAIEVELARLQRGLDAVRRRDDLLDRAAYAILDRIEAGDTSASALATALHLDQSTIARQVAAAEAKALLVRSPASGRGRGQLLALTPKGRRELDRARQDRIRRIHATLAAWDDAERAELARVLAQLNDAIVHRLDTRPTEA